MKRSLCYFGSYAKEYPRNLLTKKAFKELGWEIIDCFDSNSGIKHYVNLIREFLKLKDRFEVMFIGVLGHYDVPLAWILAKIYGKKIIFDTFYSVYEAYVEDRKNISKFSLQALRFYLYDLISTKLADVLILDTSQNRDFFKLRYNISIKKTFVLPVSADPDIFKHKLTKRHKPFTIGFYGSFLLLHGVEVIVDAISRIDKYKVKVLLMGSGPNLMKIKKMVEDLGLQDVITFLPNYKYEDLPKFYEKIDLFLGGHFGEGSKAKNVLPAKVAESLSIGIPTIISRNPANEELLSNYKGDILWLNEITGEGLFYKIDEFYKTRYLKNRIRNLNKDYFNNSELSFKNFKDKIEMILDFVKR